jgi:hypothetical protein
MVENNVIGFTKWTNGCLGTIELCLHELARYMKALLPTSTTMEIDGKYDNVELPNTGDMGVVMDMEKVTQASQRLNGVPMEVPMEGGNKDVAQGYKTWQDKEECNEVGQELGQAYKIGQDKKTCNEAKQELGQEYKAGQNKEVCNEARAGPRI